MDYSIWKTHDGILINIKDMSTEHIKNCIKMIKRSRFLDVMERYDTVPEPPPRYIVNYKEYVPYLKVFEEELWNRDNKTK